MLCNNCHSRNADGAAFCAVCGMELMRRAPGYYQGQDVGRGGCGYPPDYVVAAPVKPRSVGAIVFYMISGLVALICMGLPFLPCVDLMPSLGTGVVEGRYLSTFSYTMMLLSGKDIYYVSQDAGLTGIYLLLMFAIPMFFFLLWAVFSFLRMNAAGGMGLTGSIILVQVGVYWLLYLMKVVNIGNMRFTGGYGGSEKYLTIVPYAIVAAGVLGIVFSSIQLTMRGRVR